MEAKWLTDENKTSFFNRSLPDGWDGKPCWGQHGGGQHGGGKQRR